MSICHLPLCRLRLYNVVEARTAKTMMHAFKPPSIKQLKNEEALKVYALSLLLLILVIVVARWVYRHWDRAQHRNASRGQPGHVFRAVSLASHTLEQRVDWKWFGRPSIRLMALLSIYVTGNVFLSSTVLASYQVNHLASRFGWLGAANMALCVFFGLKNTPLGFLTPVSHAQLNILHRIVGYATVFLVVLHAIFYTIHFGRLGRWMTLMETSNLEGIGAGLCMFVLLMGIFRHRGYEIFYVSHIVGFVAAVILTGMHRPDWAKKLPVVMLFTGCLWVLDRIVRATRMTCNLINNQVTLYPLPDGGTRLFLKKSFGQGVAPGSHCFLWIPRIQLYQMHPFTIVSSGPSGMELVIKAHQGFTRAMSEFAAHHPGRAVHVAVDGPYGSSPDPTMYDKLVLIAGGSGAAFTFGIFNRLLNDAGRIPGQSIDFVWAVRRTEHLSWFYEHLQNLTRLGPSVNGTLYVTSEQSTVNTNDPMGIIDGLGEREVIERMASMTSSNNYGDVSELGEMRGLLSETAFKADEHAVNVEYKKMNIEAILSDSMPMVGSHQRVLVAACGPKLLMDAVRDSAAHCRVRTGHRIEVHCEDFSS